MLLKVLDGIKLLLRIISCVMICCLTIIVTMQVVNRNFFDHAFTWVEEVAGMAMVYVTFLGAAMATINNTNTRIDFFIRLLPSKGTYAFEILGDLICIGFLGMVSYLSTGLMEKNMKIFSPALKLPMAINYFAILLGCVLMIVFYLVRLWLDAQKIAGKNVGMIEEELIK